MTVDYPWGYVNTRMAVMTMDYFTRPDMTYEKLGERYELSRARVEQLIKRTLRLCNVVKPLHDKNVDIDALQLRMREWLSKPRYLLDPDTPEGFYHLEMNKRAYFQP